VGTTFTTRLAEIAITASYFDPPRLSYVIVTYQQYISLFFTFSKSLEIRSTPQLVIFRLAVHTPLLSYTAESLEAVC
jgi:hypothetical protein